MSPHSKGLHTVEGRTKRIGRWRQQLTVDDARQCWYAGGEALAALGYTED